MRTAGCVVVSAVYLNNAGDRNGYVVRNRVMVPMKRCSLLLLTAVDILLIDTVINDDISFRKTFYSLFKCFFFVFFSK